MINFLKLEHKMDSKLKTGMRRLPIEIYAKIFNYVSSYDVVSRFVSSKDAYIELFTIEHCKVIHKNNNNDLIIAEDIFKLKNLRMIEPLVFTCGNLLHVDFFHAIRNAKCILVTNSDRHIVNNVQDILTFVDSYLRFDCKSLTAYCLCKKGNGLSDEHLFSGGEYDCVVVSGKKIYLPQIGHRHIAKYINKLHPNSIIVVNDILMNIPSEQLRLILKSFGF